ncbi:MAG: CYTH domain-containing protein, partial [Anaerolineae bacterium]
MEIEAKFAVPDRDTCRRLAQLRELAGFRLAPRGVGQVADRYFDTADGRLRRGGFACRLRAEGDLIVATLKGLGRAEGAVHRRAEEEVRLSTWNPDPTTWPAGPARDLALELAGGATLAPLFDLTQRRLRRDLRDGDRLVAALSLDSVRLHLTGLRRPARAAYYELEVELAGEGQEADLAAVVKELTEAWGLAPEPRSKFERALALLEARRAAFDLGLTAEERRALAAQATAETPYGRRAAAVLGWDEGWPTAEIARRCGFSPGRVRYWVRAFRNRRLGILA